jgi:hypothetical protein
MSNPRWMMEPDFEEDEDAGYDYSDAGFEEDNLYYKTNGGGVCTICMGGSFVRKIYIENYWEEQEGDEDDYDY